MKISELIEALQTLKEEHGDLPAMLQVDSEYDDYPYYECVQISHVQHDRVLDEDSGHEEILNFIALDYC